MNRGVLTGWRPLTERAERFIDLGVQRVNTTLVLSYASCGNYALDTSPSAVTLSVRDWPPAGQIGIITIEWTGANNITWPSTWTWHTDSAAAPAVPSGGKKMITAETRDGGLTVFASASA